jgi:hypothetical protein
VKVRLKVRFEDFEIDAPPEGFTATSPGELEAFGGGSLGGDDPTNPYVRTYDIEPYEFSVELNGPREADTASVSFPRAKMPFDPQIIRSATLQIFAGVFSSREVGEAMQSPGARGVRIPDIVPPGRPFAGQSNEIFRGFVDDWDIKLGDGQSIVQIKARDSTGFFMDAEIPENPLKGLPKDLTIDKIIKGMLLGPAAINSTGLYAGASIRGLPGAMGTAVVVETSRPVPTLAEIKPPTWFTQRGTAAKGRRQAANSKKMKFWDFITDLCVAAGLKAYVRPGRIPQFVEGLGFGLPAAEIVITDAATYYAGTGGEIRTFAWGHNVRELSIKRKLGGVPVPTIEVRSFDIVTRKQIIGRYPPKAKRRVNKATPTGKGDREEVTVYELDELSGPRAEDQANEAARHIYDALARGEFEGMLRTTALSAIPANEDNELAADMLYLRPGDTIRVITDPAREEYGVVTFEGRLRAMSVNQFFELLRSQGFDDAVALAAANATYDPRVQREFFVQSFGITWDKDRGFAFDLGFINYLDVRGAVQ